MTRLPFFSRLLFLFALIVSLAGSSGMAAAAQDDPPGSELVPPAGALPSGAPAGAPPAAPTPGLTYLSFNSMMFYPYLSSLSYQYNFPNGTLHTVAPSSTGSFIMPLDLPNGVEIREMTVWFRDNQPAQDITFGLCVVPNGGSTQFCLEDQVDTTANGNTGAVVSRSLTGSPLETIDNYNNSYFLAATVQVASVQYGIVSAQIGYTNTTFLPSVSR